MRPLPGAAALACHVANILLTLSLLPLQPTRTPRAGNRPTRIGVAPQLLCLRPLRRRARRRRALPGRRQRQRHCLHPVLHRSGLNEREGGRLFYGYRTPATTSMQQCVVEQ